MSGGPRSGDRSAETDTESRVPRPRIRKVAGRHPKDVTSRGPTYFPWYPGVSPESASLSGGEGDGTLHFVVEPSHRPGCLGVPTLDVWESPHRGVRLPERDQTPGVGEKKSGGSIGPRSHPRKRRTDEEWYKEGERSLSRQKNHTRGVED